MRLFGDDYPTPDGTCVRDYIHVTDLARAHMLALEACTPGEHRVYNLGSGAGFSNLEVLSACREVTGQDIPVAVRPAPAGDPAVLVASSGRIHAELGWRAKRGLRRDGRRRLAVHPGAVGSRPARPARRAVSLTADQAAGRFRRLARRGTRRCLARAGPGEPDRRAHRLQLRLGAAVRAGPGRGGGRRAARRRRAGHPLAAVREPGRRAAARAAPRRRDRLGRLPGRCRLGHAGGRPPRGRGQPGHRLRPAAGRWPVVLGRDRVRRGDRPGRAVRGGRAAGRTRRPGQAGGERDGRRAQRDHGPVRVAALRGRARPAARLPQRGDHRRCRSTRRRPGSRCSWWTPAPGTR